MHRRIGDVLLTALAVCAMCSCAHDAAHPTRSGHASGRKGEAAAMRDDQFETQPKRQNMYAVMQAKLSHSQAILEGITLANFRQIELNANDLFEISRSADWMVHDTESYFAFSEEFRNITSDLGAHARLRDLNAVADDYARLTQSCVACHRYLRLELQTKDLPGKISRMPQDE
jgi:cytochrome c556